MRRSVLESERRRGIDRVTLSSAHNKNALSIELLEGLIRTVERNAEDSRSRGLVIGHAGDVFCAGIDLVERRRLPPLSATHSALLAELLTGLWNLEVPVICHVHGAVRGGGMGILSCADIVVASRASHFAYSEVRVGVAPALVGAVALATSPSRGLLPLLLTGRRFDVTEARSAGVVTQVSDDDGDDTVQHVIEDLLRSGPNAVRTTKALTRGATTFSVTERIIKMTELSAQLFETREAKEGMAAFAEKRSPVWPYPVA